MDIIGYQMADGTSGGVASGLENEIEELRRKKQAEEDRRMGRVTRRQKELGKDGTVYGMPPEGGLPSGAHPGERGIDSMVNAGASTALLFGFGSAGGADSAVFDADQQSSSSAVGATDWTIPLGNDGTVRVGISKEMQEKLDRVINSQVNFLATPHPVG